MRIHNGIVAMIKNTFIGNRAGRGGGSVYFEHLEGEDILANITFSNSGRRSGAVETWRYPSILENITFIENVAIRNGGGVALFESSMNIVNCKFSSNMAGRHGGSVLLDEGTFSITNSSFSNNTA